MSDEKFNAIGALLADKITGAAALRKQIREEELEHERQLAAIRRGEDASAPTHPPSVSVEVERRAQLLAEYKAATGNPSNLRIYEAENSGIHKPQFYEWRKGTLSSSSATTINFERFLRDKKPPLPR